MDVEQIRDYCLARKGVTEGFPFGEETLVFKVGGRIFLLLSLDASPPQFNVKCDPLKAVELREKYHFVMPGYHMNKTHWNTVVCEPGATGSLLRQCIDDSYALVAGALPASTRKKLGI